MHVCECTPGGSLTHAKHNRAGAIVRVKERICGEDRNRKVLMYAFPVKGGNKTSPESYAEYDAKTHHLGPAHYLYHILRIYTEKTGQKAWSDSVHPTLQAQEYLREIGAKYAREWTEETGRTMPREASERPLLIVLGDGWNTLRKKEYWELRVRFEQCKTVGDIMDLPIPVSAFLAQPTVLLPPVVPSTQVTRSRKIQTALSWWRATERHQNNRVISD